MILKGFLSHANHGIGIFTYIWLIFIANVEKYTIHGWYGFEGFFVVAFLVEIWSCSLDLFPGMTCCKRCLYNLILTLGGGFKDFWRFQPFLGK